MVINETPNEDLSQAGGIDLTGLDAIYEAVMDQSLTTGPARTVTLHLQPVLSASSGAAVTHRAFEYDPIMKTGFRIGPTERAPGVHKEYRQVQYKAHIKHGPTDLNSDDPLGRVADNEIQITTVIGSEKHIRDALELEVDGRKYKLSRGPRPIGWQAAKYLISIWAEHESVSDGAK